MTDINGRAVAVREQSSAVLEQVVVQGDLSRLSPDARVTYYNEVCKSLGLNPLTQPFQYITLNGKLTLYARRDCTDQLRRLHRINLTIVSRERQEDVYVVLARAQTPDGRTDESIGAVAIGAVKGEALANALMKCETKAKRRATLSIVGLGWLDETEVETIPDARVEPPAEPAALPSAPAWWPRYFARWSALVDRAQALGIGLDAAITPQMSQAECERRGQDFAARIERAEKFAAEQADAGEPEEEKAF